MGNRRRLYLVLLAMWVALTFVLTSLPNQKVQLPFHFGDKAAHLGFYAVMGFFCALWRRECGVPLSRAVAQALLFVALVGAVDEVHQHWIPGRSMDLFDWMADICGGAAGGLVSAVLPRWFPALVTE